jgi:hypothetical protein
MEEYASKNQKARWAEKSTSHIYCLLTMLRLYPDAYYILIVRDPRDTYLSDLNYQARQSKFLKTKEWALKWHRTYLNAVKIFLQHSKQFHFYRHETFINNQLEELKKVLTFLREPFEPDCLEITFNNSSFDENKRGISASSIGRWKTGLSKKSLKVIETVCADTMRLFDYERSDAGCSIKERSKKIIKQIRDSR